jgi:hypothetical protein
MTAWETIAGFATNPGGAFTALINTAGQSSTVRNTDLNARVVLQDMWADGATAGVFRIRSPRLHDNVQGIRFQNAAAQRNQLLGWYPDQLLVPQDTLVTEITGGAAETDMGAYVISYDSLPGSDGQYATWDQIRPRIAHIVTVEVATTASATVGNWSNGTAINATFDLTWANSWYAILGYVVNVAVTAIAIQGPDTGSLKNGGPGSLNYVDTRNYFVFRDQLGSTPAIPVFNSANKGGTFIFVADKAASTAVNVDLVCALLKGSTLPNPTAISSIA